MRVITTGRSSLFDQALDRLVVLEGLEQGRGPLAVPLEHGPGAGDAGAAGDRDGGGDWDLTGTYASVYLTHIGFGLPLALLILRSYMATLPAELTESAGVDGPATGRSSGG
jgi:hypothetical protein